MAATVEIMELNGVSPGTPTAVTSARFCTMDSSNPGTQNPLVKPDTGQTNRSYIKTFYLNATTAPTGTINNVKFYTENNIDWTGITVNVGTTDTYTQATGTLGTTAAASVVATTNINTYTSSNMLSLAGEKVSSTGKITDNYVVMQAVVSDAATAGNPGSENVIWRYDET